MNDCNIKLDCQLLARLNRENFLKGGGKNASHRVAKGCYSI